MFASANFVYIQQFNGVWYTIENYPELWAVGTCPGARYTENSEEERIDVRDWHFVDDEPNIIEGYLTRVAGTTNNAARFISTMPSRLPGDNPEICKKFFLKTSMYYVLNP